MKQFIPVTNFTEIPGISPRLIYKFLKVVVGFLGKTAGVEYRR